MAVGNVPHHRWSAIGGGRHHHLFLRCNAALGLRAGAVGANTTYTYYDDGSFERIDRDELIGNTVTLRTEQRTYWPTGELMDLTDPAGKVNAL